MNHSVRSNAPYIHLMRYSVTYLDGLYVKLQRNTVSSEVVNLIMGIDEKGIHQILGFHVGGHESSDGWREVRSTYLQALDYNEKWCGRAIRGFVDVETKFAFEKMYSERYGER